MKDYEILITIKNNYLLTAMRKNGYQTAAALAGVCGVSSAQIGAYIDLKKYPRRKNGEWRPSVQKIADFLKRDPSQLFPPQRLDLPLGNKLTMKADFGSTLVLGSETYP